MVIGATDVVDAVVVVVGQTSTGRAASRTYAACASPVTPSTRWTV